MCMVYFKTGIFFNAFFQNFQSFRKTKTDSYPHSPSEAVVSPGRTLRYEGFSPVASGLEKPLLAGYKRGKRNDLFLAWMTTTVSLKREGEKATLSSYIYPAEVDFPTETSARQLFCF